MVGAAVLAGGGIALALSGYVASQLVLVAVAVALARWWVGPIPIRFDPTGLRRLARDTTPFFVLVFLDLLLFKIDTVMIWFLQTPVEVALYESAYKFLEVSRSVVRPLGLIFLPVCVQIATRADWPEFRTLTTRLVSAATSLGAVTAALVILAGGSALPWVWGDAYTDAIPVLRVLFLSVPAVFVAFVSQILVTALRLERSAIQGMALAVVLNVALNAAVIPRWGAIGAAWTTLASELLIAALMLRLVARGIRQRLSAGPRVADLEPAESDREQVILR
ncbi:MAG: polysaccharide biosynthesis C-terminal domain-containing protein [Gemmatimonadetes bacterium]|nr:polysaccharide biosynthesis C-terminal domain-containing protein [Gemmatimonadota bacterium]